MAARCCGSNKGAAIRAKSRTPRSRFRMKARTDHITQSRELVSPACRKWHPISFLENFRVSHLYNSGKLASEYNLWSGSLRAGVGEQIRIELTGYNINDHHGSLYTRPTYPDMGSGIIAGIDSRCDRPQKGPQLRPLVGLWGYAIHCCPIPCSADKTGGETG